MLLVLDTDIAINLARIGELGVLSRLYSNVATTSASWREAKGQSRADMKRAIADGHLAIVRLSTLGPVRRRVVKSLFGIVRRSLDLVEAAAVCAALELGGAVATDDKAAARIIKEMYGLPCYNHKEILFELQERGLLPSDKVGDIYRRLHERDKPDKSGHRPDWTEVRQALIRRQWSTTSSS